MKFIIEEYSTKEQRSHYRYDNNEERTYYYVDVTRYNIIYKKTGQIVESGIHYLASAKEKRKNNYTSQGINDLAKKLVKLNDQKINQLKKENSEIIKRRNKNLKALKGYK